MHIILIFLLICFLFYIADSTIKAFVNIGKSICGKESLTESTKVALVWIIAIPLLVLWIAYLVTR